MKKYWILLICMYILSGCSTEDISEAFDIKLYEASCYDVETEEDCILLYSFHSSKNYLYKSESNCYYLNDDYSNYSQIYWETDINSQNKGCILFWEQEI